jgi:ribosomal protein L11 methyltransferase
VPSSRGRVARTASRPLTPDVGRWTRVELCLDAAAPGADTLDVADRVGIVLDALVGLGCLGAEELEVADPDRAARLVAYLPAGVSAEDVERVLHAALSTPPRLVGIETVADGRWVERFNASLQPLDIGARLTILPRGGEAPTGRLAIHVEPGRAFGTGHHESTRLALEWLEELVTPGAVVLDVGTGSGILALAAARLGAGAVVGVDTDPEAIEVARQNLERLPERAVVTLREEAAGNVAGRPWDLVVANIARQPILEALPTLLSATRPGGWLVLSGLLAEDETAIHDALCQAGLRPRWTRAGDWSAAACSRPSPS